MNYLEKQVLFSDYNLNQLPTGILLEGEKGKYIGRDIMFRKLSHLDLKRINNTEYAEKHPLRWVAETISTVVDSICGVPVYSAFAAGNFKFSAVPDIVKHIRSVDSIYVLFAGHVYNFGYKVDDVDIKCRNRGCGKLNTRSINLGTMKISQYYNLDGSLYDIIDIPVNLPDGYLFKPENEEGITFKKFMMHLPTLGYGIEEESNYYINNQGSFHEKVYGKCIDSMVGDSETFIRDKVLMIGGIQIFNKLSAEDSRSIERSINDTPRLIPYIDETCMKCSGDLDMPVTAAFLYRRQ